MIMGKKWIMVRPQLTSHPIEPIGQPQRSHVIARRPSWRGSLGEWSGRS
jgi:hypothetical protein